MSAVSPVFGHSPLVLRQWRDRVRRARRAGARTPFYIFASAPVAAAYAQLDRLDFGRPIRHWFSAKTQPLAPLWRWWRARGGLIEVVSEFEFRAALAEGFSPDCILVNGPAKHRWLPEFSQPGLRVNFDSPRELAALLPIARRDRWRLGLRLRTPDEVDPEFPRFPTQFGFEPDEAAAAIRQLHRAGLPAETVHFHLRTQVPSATDYAQALDSVAELCRCVGWKPRHVDLGGGLPAPLTLSHEGRRFDARMDLTKFATVVRRTVERLPFVEEVWLENGRFVSAGSGVLVVRVLDVKDRPGIRQLICDGGRTLNALVASWEEHAIQPLESRAGRRVLTAVHGPTCMAFDCLARRRLPASLRQGDHLLWHEAGAYHLPWETRFSHGLAEVWWEDETGLTKVRAAESFEQYWSKRGESISG
ncbi:MAG TPA: hypothetical protein PLX89_09865 [Verrucomicrobiota bacterium]|nr:hypothetical protein [Verrucomicrobiales bacterium]HRI13302.1 hypothetical protein [Verrucomicrobiota bacterium]